MDNSQETITSKNPNNLTNLATNIPNTSPQNITPDLNSNLMPNPVPNTSLTRDQSSADLMFTNKGYKKKKAIKIILAIIIAILCVGTISFIVMLAISIQPENMVASALNKLFTSKNVSVDGNINITIKSADVSLSLELNTKQLDQKNSIAATAQINLPDLNQPTIISFNEVSINHGTIYLKVRGASKAIGAYSEIINGSEEQKNDSTIDMILDIVSSIEDRWVKISYEELYSGSNQYISNAYSCVTDKFNNKIDYAGELIILYKDYSFLNMEKEKDDFYNISLNTSHFTQFINSIPNTKLAKDINNCLGNTTTSTNEISENDVESIYSYLPRISAKFNKDGLFSYELAELKITDDTDSYNIDSDLNFNYTDNDIISEPTGNIVSIRKLIKEITLKYIQTQLY